MAVGRLLTKAEVALLGLPLGGVAPKSWRTDWAQMMAYPVYADGSEGEPFDLVPLYAFLRKENGDD